MIRTEDSPKTYHVALLKGQYSGHRKDTVVLQLRRDIDCLYCEMWRYLGQTLKTKQDFKDDKELLKNINELFDGDFKRVIVD